MITIYYLRQGGYKMIGVYLSVCLCVCECVCVFVCHQHYVKSYGWIWMKLSGNIGNRTRKNWLTFERDPDPDTDFGSGSGENGWTHFHETFKICCPYGKDEHMWFWRWFGSGSDPDQSEIFCLAVLHKVQDQFQWNLVDMFGMSQRQTCQVLVMIRIRIPILDPDSGETATPIFTKFSGYVAAMNRTNIYDFGDDPD